MVHTSKMLFHLCGRGVGCITTDLPGLNHVNRSHCTLLFMDPVLSLTTHQTLAKTGSGTRWPLAEGEGQHCLCV